MCLSCIPHLAKQSDQHVAGTPAQASAGQAGSPLPRLHGHSGELLSTLGALCLILTFILKHHAVKASHYKTHRICFTLKVWVFPPFAFMKCLFFFLPVCCWSRSSKTKLSKLYEPEPTGAGSCSGGSPLPHPRSVSMSRTRSSKARRLTASTEGAGLLKL